MSWGNALGNWNNQDMDSEGKKLKVNGDSQGGSNYQAEFSDSNDLGQAVKVDGAIHLFRNGVLNARIQPNIVTGNPALNINTGNGDSVPADPSIFIGQTASSPAGGNDTYLGSRHVTIRQGGSANDEYPVAINGPVRMLNTTGADPDIALRTEGVVITTGIELPDGENTIRIGTTTDTDNDATDIRIGRGAGTESGDGSNVTIKGDLSIVAGEAQSNQGDLSVARQITCEGNLNANAVSYLQGNVNMLTTAQCNGNYTVGTAQTPATTTLNGDADINGNADISGTSALHGHLTVGTAQTTANATVYGTSTLKDDVTIGTSQANANTTMNGNLLAKDVAGNAISAKTGLSVGAAQTPANATVYGLADIRTGLTLGTAQVATSATLYATTEITKTLKVTDKATLKNGIDFNDSGTIFSIRQQNNHFEFLIGGTRVFYIDTAGGHNG